MANTQAAHPLSSHESALPQERGIGVLCALLTFLFGDAIAALIEKLQTMFEAWQAGTLPPMPERPAVVARTPRARQPRVRKRHTSVRRRTTVARILMRDLPPRPITWHARIQSPLMQTCTHPPIFFQKRVFADTSSHAHIVTISQSNANFRATSVSYALLASHSALPNCARLTLP